jgi:hypothetical protein
LQCFSRYPKPALAAKVANFYLYVFILIKIKLFLEQKTSQIVNKKAALAAKIIKII